MIDLGANIYAERKKANIKQYKLAEAIQIGQTAISRFENNTRKPSIAVLKKIAAALGCSFAALVKEKQDVNNDLDKNKSTKANSLNNEENPVPYFIQTLLAQSLEMNVKLYELSKRSEDFTKDDWVFLADHMVHAFNQIEFLLNRKKQ